MTRLLADKKIPNSPLFIVSSGRSGTTLLRSILNRTKQIYIPFESDFIARGYPYFGHVKNFDDQTLTQTTDLFIRSALGDGWELDREDLLEVLKQNHPTSFAQVNHIIYSFYLYHNEIEEKTWAIKTPVLIENIDRILKTFPNARIVHLVRDGRDVCISFRNVHKIRSGAEKFGPNSILANALYWIDGLRRIKTYKKKHNRIFELRYEDVVTAPEQTITQLLDFLHIPFDLSLLSVDNDNDKFFLKKHNTSIHQNIGKPLLRTNIYKYKKQMSKRDRLFYELIANPFLKKYGYNIEFKFSSWMIWDVIRTPMYYTAQIFNNYKNRNKDKRIFKEAMNRHH
ncbi:sulfotransferase [Catalinimonas sp. 4WD22]|uniref:sulfotransferase family protein n=1 Tax=Catalinimonas locisalis TaxID=3133978 RepID=UPI003100E3FD